MVKELPPPPVPGHGSLATTKVAPLQSKNEEESGKRPLLIVSSEPSEAAPPKPTAAPAIKPRADEKSGKQEKGPSTAAALAELPSNQLKPGNTNPTEQLRETPSTTFVTAHAFERPDKIQNQTAVESTGVKSPRASATTTNSAASKAKRVPEAVAQVRTSTAHSGLAAKPPPTSGTPADLNTAQPSEVRPSSSSQASPELAAKLENHSTPLPMGQKSTMARPNSRTFFFAGAGLLLLASVIAWLCLRPSRAPHQFSLISQGLDREGMEGDSTPPKFIDRRC
jgi:hypothetical protein